MRTFAAAHRERSHPAHSAARSSSQSLRPHPEVRRLLSRPKPQAKLEVGSTHNPHEAEADRVADQVMRMPEAGAPRAGTAPAPIVQRMCPDCEDEMQRKPSPVLQRSAAGADGGTMDGATEHAVRGLRGGGKPLPASERAFFEPRFGRSFENVRIHDGQTADRASRQISARAFTLGGDIAFSRGQYRPGTSEGRRLLAHELTHTIQQGGGGEQARRAPDRVQRSRVTISTTGCSNNADIRKIAEGIAGGRAMTQTAQAWFLSTSASSRMRINSLLTAVFMANDTTTRDAVRDRVLGTAQNLREMGRGTISFTCAPATDKECTDRSGYVRATDRTQVSICPSFFNLGLEERKWMIVHEAAHLAGALGPELYYADFGTVDCTSQPSAISTTADALDNADSYARFIWCLTRPASTVLRNPAP